MISKIADIKPLLSKARANPDAVFPEFARLAASTDWQTREVAATALVETGKKHPQRVARLALSWTRSDDPNVRRAASEGLRGIVKVQPALVWPVLERLKADADLYVKKSVANVLRNASAKHPDAVLALCRRWMQTDDRNTRWIVQDGLRKLKGTHPREVATILDGTPPRE